MGSAKGASSNTKETLTQTSHGFAAKDVIRYDGTGSAYVKAKADTTANAEALGVVESVSGDQFTVVYVGRIVGLSGLTAGYVYRLSEETAGLLVSTDTPEGSVHKPMLIATSSTSGVVLQTIGYLVS